MSDETPNGTNFNYDSFGLFYKQSVDLYAGSWIEIRQSAFDHNIACYVKEIGLALGIAIVIKSNGYGHGLENIAVLCQNNKHVSWICTSTISEALRIRALGITKSILVLAHSDTDPNFAHKNTISLAVHDVQSAQKLSALATGTFSVHIKIDTGLSRFGISAEDAVESVKQIMALPYIHVQGIYTHFAVSGEMKNEYIYKQNKLFSSIICELELRGIHIPFCHAAKSAVAASIKEARYSLIRLGAGAYGLCAKEIGLPLRQLLTWKARIIHIRTVPAGSYVGYNQTYQAVTTMRVAVLPVGYYEGYPLSLSNKGQVFVLRTQQLAPVIGRIGMNQTIIDISHINDDLVLGDVVELIGDHAGVTSADLARECASNNERELIARLNTLISRIVV